LVYNFIQYTFLQIKQETDLQSLLAKLIGRCCYSGSSSSIRVIESSVRPEKTDMFFDERVDFFSKQRRNRKGKKAE
jgi:hypothetical protein